MSKQFVKYEYVMSRQMSVCQRLVTELVTDWKMEIEDQLGDGVSSTAMSYSGKRHVCTRIDKYQNNLARFTKLPANSDWRKSEIKKKKLFKPWPFFRTVCRGVWHFGHNLNTIECCTLSTCKPYIPKIAII